MKKVLRAIFSGIGITVILAVILSAALWFLGGFLGFGEARPFDGVTGRLVGIGVIWVIALIVILIILIRRGKKDADMADDIVSTPEPEASPGDEIVAAELGEMRDKLKTAMAQLRKS